MGKIAKVEQKNGSTNLTIQASAIAKKTKKGDSVSVDGACLTVTAMTKSTITVQAIPETLARTIIPAYKINQQVNLETPLKMGEELHGHLVQGHVDFTGTVAQVKADKDSTILQISFPPEMAKYLALKGSITVNGVSLTVSFLKEKAFEVSLIPETIKSTNLNLLKKDSKVNVEVDLIARYLDSLLQDMAQQTTYEFLKERNLI